MYKVIELQRSLNSDSDLTRLTDKLVNDSTKGFTLNIPACMFCNKIHCMVFRSVMGE